MAKIIKVLKTLRNHWKKSIFAFGLLGYGTNYARDRYSTERMMHAYCEEAQRYGEMPILASNKAKHITVILNPVAKNGKGKVLYEKYAAPLLHLAGLKVSIFQTDQEGQAKDLMEVMDHTDAVVVAGGNGTLHEAVTGLLRREDADSATHRFPIGIIPIGKTNSIARAFFPHSNDAQLLAESAMAVIKEVKKPLDVMKVEGSKGRPVYALSDLELGVFRDTDTNISKYWYLGPLKDKVAYIVRALKEWPSNQEFELSYVYPCDGCSKCYEPPQKELTPNKRWWQSFLPRATEISTIENKTEGVSLSVKAFSPTLRNYSDVINEECGIWHTEDIPASNIMVETNNVENTEFHIKEDSALNITIYSPNLTRWQFIKVGSSAYKDKTNEEPLLRRVMKIREMKLLPKDTMEKEQWCNIDKEHYEVQPVHIRLLPRKVYIYCKEFSVNKL